MCVFSSFACIYHVDSGLSSGNLTVCVLLSFASIYHVGPGVSSGNFTIELFLVLTCCERSGGFYLLSFLPVQLVSICAAWCLCLFVLSLSVRGDAKQHKCDHVSCL